MNINKLKTNNKNKILACFLAGTMAMTGLTGCEKRDKLSPFDNTIFDNARVVTFEDGSKDLVEVSPVGKRYCYKSLVNQLRYCDEDDWQKIKGAHVGIDVAFEIKDVDEYIAKYFTKEELIKLQHDEMTQEEQQKIIDRIVKPETEKVRVK